MHLLWKRKHLWLIGSLAAANAVIVLTDLAVLRYLSAVLLLFCLPGLVLMELAAEVGRVERLALGCGLSYVLASLAALIVHYLPGPMSMVSILLGCDLLTLGLLLLLLVRPHLIGAFHHKGHNEVRHTRYEMGDPNSERSLFSRFSTLPSLTSLLGLLVVAALPRLVFLGYSEFQGDEAVVMFKAAQAIEGQDHVLFTHGKGPAEILIPAATWLLTGRITELGARLPFALAGLLGVVALYLLGRSMFNRRAGFLAGLLLAVNGYFVGFGRVVQYQSLVLAMMGLALLCAYRFYRDEGGGYAILSALFLSCGLLAHYDALLVLPAVVYLLARRWASGKRWLLLSLIVVLAVSLLFYLPFVCDPQFARTCAYLTGARMGGSLLNNNLAPFFILSTVYNSTYYLVFMITLLGGAIVAGLFGASFRASLEWQACFMWWIVPFVFYIFVVAYPLTHVYTFFPAWCLFGGLALAEIDRLLRKIRWATVGRTVFVVLYLIFAWYIFLVFVWHDPEYKRTYPAHKNAFYWTVYGQLPPAGYFGFPYRAGWKAVGELYRTGLLQGDYASNEESVITAWYTRNAPLACEKAQADYLFLAQNVQDERSIPQDVLSDYLAIGAVQVNGRPKLHLYQRRPAGANSGSLSGALAVEDYEADFDRRATPGSFAAPPDVEHPLEVNLGGQVRLLGYDLDERRAGTLNLALYWQAERRMEVSWHVFTHLEKDGRIWGQSDGVPVCGGYPTTDWRPGTVIVDRRRMTVDPYTPPGRYPLLVGLYEAQSGQRLEVLDQAGKPQGSSVLLQEVTVK